MICTKMYSVPNFTLAIPLRGDDLYVRGSNQYKAIHRWTKGRRW